jgi:hypothetical protein
VWPSAGACTTAFAAMLPLPPGRFSTITLCPRIGPMAWARIRAMVSTVPPGLKPTMMWIVRSGKAARAMRGAARSPAPPAARPVNLRRVMALMLRTPCVR